MSARAQFKPLGRTLTLTLSLTRYNGKGEGILLSPLAGERIKVGMDQRHG